MKCGKKKHEFEGNNVKCVCGKANKWWFVCVRCKVASVAKIGTLPCEDCQKDPKYVKELADSQKNQKSLTRVKHYREATAFGYDKKTGKPVALDRRGRRFDPTETRYDFAKDPHGWKATDKIPKKKK